MSGSNTLSAAILIISETATKDPSTDKGIPALQEVFKANGRWGEVKTAIVPDDVLQIQRMITQWTDGEDFVNLIVTSGGTGFATKDVTPEVGGLPYTLARGKYYEWLVQIIHMRQGEFGEPAFLLEDV